MYVAMRKFIILFLLPLRDSTMLVREPCGGNRSRHTRHDTKTHGMHVSGPIDMLTESQKQHLKVAVVVQWEKPSLGRPACHIRVLV